MTNNPTIDGVSRELLERLLTDACNENWSDLNELLHSTDACRCRRFGKDNPHWPCPVHSAQGDQRGPTAAMTEAVCQAYMDADGMIGIMHNSSMGHAYVAMRALDPEVAALQSTIAQLQERIAELESGRGEPVYQERAGGGWIDIDRAFYEMCLAEPEDHSLRIVYTAQTAPVAVDECAEFENWVTSYAEEINYNWPELVLNRDGDCYATTWVDSACIGWNARACLDATAALNGVKS